MPLTNLVKNSVWNFWLWSIWLPLGNPEFLRAAPWCLSAITGRGRYLSMEGDLSDQNKANCVQVLKVTPKTRSEGEQRTTSPVLGLWMCFTTRKHLRNSGVSLFSLRELSPCLCHHWANLCGLGKAGVNPPQRCVNKEHFDPSLIPSLCFELSLVSPSRIFC